MQLVGLGDGARHALRAGGEHNLRTIGGGELATLDAHGLGHGEDHLVAAGRGEHGEADAGVSARGLDDGAAGLELAGRLGRVEHVAGDAVLYGAAGVRGLVLAQDTGAVGADVLGQQRVEVDEGGGADEGLDVVGDVHGMPPCGGGALCPWLADGFGALFAWAVHVVGRRYLRLVGDSMSLLNQLNQ